MAAHYRPHTNTHTYLTSHPQITTNAELVERINCVHRQTTGLKISPSSRKYNQQVKKTTTQKLKIKYLQKGRWGIIFYLHLKQKKGKHITRNKLVRTSIDFYFYFDPPNRVLSQFQSLFIITVHCTAPARKI